MREYWEFVGLIVSLIALVVFLVLLMGGPEPDEKSDEWPVMRDDRSIAEHWAGKQREEAKARLAKTEAPGLVHTDDLGP